MKFSAPQWHEELASTNAYLLEILAQEPGTPSGLVAAARRQTAGRGRAGRIWRSSPGRDLTFSFILRTQTAPDFWPSLGQAAALAVAETVGERGVRAAVKWPNDVRVGGRKLAGLLVESPVTRIDGAPASSAKRVFVVGIGLNVNLSDSEAAEFDQPVTSLAIETGREEPPEAVLRDLLEKISNWLDRWEAGGFSALREAWLQRVENLGQPVSVGHGNQRRQGILAGFGSRGELLLQNPTTNKNEPIWSGDLDSL